MSYQGPPGKPHLLAWAVAMEVSSEVSKQGSSCTSPAHVSTVHPRGLGLWCTGAAEARRPFCSWQMGHQFLTQGGLLKISQNQIFKLAHLSFPSINSSI